MMIEPIRCARTLTMLIARAALSSALGGDGDGDSGSFADLVDRDEDWRPVSL